jgi:hypothetical protein
MHLGVKEQKKTKLNKRLYQRPTKVTGFFDFVKRNKS